MTGNNMNINIYCVNYQESDYKDEYYEMKGESGTEVLTYFIGL